MLYLLLLAHVLSLINMICFIVEITFSVRFYFYRYSFMGMSQAVWPVESHQKWFH